MIILLSFVFLQFSCSEDQLTCGDGSCLPLSSKCDGVADCSDHLDEQLCHLVEFPLSRLYQSSLPPVVRDSKQDLIPTEVQCTMCCIPQGIRNQRIAHKLIELT